MVVIELFRKSVKKDFILKKIIKQHSQNIVNFAPLVPASPAVVVPVIFDDSATADAEAMMAPTAISPLSIPSSGLSPCLMGAEQ
jgi:hypothetical protein